MNSNDILDQLRDKNIIFNRQSEAVSGFLASEPFSVYHELRSILYLGILLFTSGIGVIVYENIDTIGHQVIIGVLIILCILFLSHAFKYRSPFSWAKINPQNKLADHSLLLGCSLFLILEGYVQYQYTFFGTRYGLAVAIPTLLFFLLAYRFDHIGVLSMALTGLASWLGLTIAPTSVTRGNDFTNAHLLITAIVLGLLLLILGKVSEQKHLKSHFSFTYSLFGANLASVAAIAGLFNHNPRIVYFIISIALSFYLIQTARKEKSALFLLVGVIYGYVAISYGLFHVVPDVMVGLLGVFYMLASSAGTLVFLLNFKKILGTKR
ncbi:MAG TPA: DUF2157 domain-containing protein [Dyadobacter sp.]|nr:DUF2157 domain-containing protein [Dyadobacter sp.]